MGKIIYFCLVFSLFLAIEVECFTKCLTDATRGVTGVGSRFFSHPNEGMREELSIYDEWNITSAVCSQECIRTTECMSYQYSHGEDRCLHFPYDSVTGPEFIISHEFPGYIYYDQVPTQSKQQNFFRGCADSKCKNGASCRTDCSQRGYYCHCAPGYRGINCQDDIYHEPVLVQEIVGSASRGSKGFTYKNEHYLVVGGWKDIDENGNEYNALNTIYKYDSITNQYEFLQYLSDVVGPTIKYDAFEINGEMYILQCNYDNAYSRLYVYKERSENETAIMEQTLEHENDTMECSDPVALGIGDYTIADEAIIASTEKNHKKYNKHFGRLESTLGYAAWAAASNNYDQWIGVNFGRRQIITGVATQGRETTNQWVTYYKITYGNDGSNYNYILDSNGVEKTFTGNVDRTSIVRNDLESTLFSRYIRIHPTAWQSHIMMRFEVYGCKVSDTPFVLHQQIATLGAWGSTFVRDSEGYPYLFISYHYDKFEQRYHNLNSGLYRWYTRYSKFVKMFDWDTDGATNPAMFTIDDVLYVAVPSEKDNGGYSSGSVIFKRTTNEKAIGCYVDDDIDRALAGDWRESSTNGIDSCIAYCRELGHPYAGMQEATKCFCGDEGYDVHGDASGQCDVTCADGNDNVCGRSERISVYSTEKQWGTFQTLTETVSGGGSTDATYFDHGDRHYLIITRYMDSSSCDHDILVYVWNSQDTQFDLRQTIRVVGCFLETEVFKVDGKVFMVAANNRKTFSPSSNQEYEAQNTIYKLEGTKFVEYWKKLSGHSAWDWEVFWRDEDLFLVQANERIDDNSYAANATLRIWQWM